MTNVVKLFIRLINSQNCTCSEEYTLSVHSNNRLLPSLVCWFVHQCKYVNNSSSKKQDSYPELKLSQLLISTGAQVLRLNLPEDRNLTYFTAFKCFFSRHYKLIHSWQRTSTSKVVFDFSFISLYRPVNLAQPYMCDCTVIIFIVMYCINTLDLKSNK